MQYASVDTYLPFAGDLAQACIPLGFFAAFCLQHQLLSPEVECVHPEIASQCRFQEGPVSALFVALGAELSDQHFSPRGQIFAARVLPEYREAFCALFGDDCWQIKDEWPQYQRIAKILVRELHGRPQTQKTSWAGRVLSKIRKLRLTQNFSNK